MSKRFEIDAVTLSFPDNGIEEQYRQSHQEVRLDYIRPGLILIALVIGTFGLADELAADTNSLWQPRLTIMLWLAGVFCATFVNAGIRHIELIVTVTLLLLGCANVTLMVLSNSVLGLVSLTVIFFYTYFSGIRFQFAIVATAATAFFYILALVFSSLTASYSVEHLFVDLPLVIAVFLTSLFTGYSAERQRKLLYAKACELEEERELHQKMALHDALTSLPNRNLFQERMTQSLARARRQNSQFALLFIDLDNFKTVNDNYGHGVGDQVLVTLARRLSAHIRAEDTVARLGGDEFVVLSEHIGTDQDVQIAARRLLAEISEPVQLNIRESDTISIRMTASVGISLCPRDGTSLDELVDRADSAMYEVKSTGKGNFKFFSESAKQDP